eukprot:TRINITY_DN19411_c0_g1_i1.p1 TRINITY_DN19411_c0_g1~~TRINITY_DN19411_c0_g1_i1.p1  ORF type:complete len:150 (+),score=76.38 TRINITY_DN19411_c0_g1_i1:77-526(+)
MIRRPPRSTQSRSSAASDVYKRQGKVVGIQKDGKDQQLGKTFGDYTVKIVNESNLGTSFGRHFDKEDELIPIITRPSVEAVKNFKKELDQDSINLLAQLIKLQNIPCLLYTSDAADDLLCVDLGGRRIIKKKNNNTIPQRRNDSVYTTT